MSYSISFSCLMVPDVTALSEIEAYSWIFGPRINMNKI